MSWSKWKVFIIYGGPVSGEICNVKLTDTYQASKVRHRTYETYRRQEILETLAQCEREVHQAEEPGKWILDGFLHTLPEATITFFPATITVEDPILSHLALLLAQESRVVRPVGKQGVRCERNQDRSDTLDKKEPLPGVQIRDVVHICQNSGREEAGQNVGDGVSGVPYRHADGVFLFRVPGRSH